MNQPGTILLTKESYQVELITFLNFEENKDYRQYLGVTALPIAAVCHLPHYQYCFCKKQSNTRRDRIMGNVPLYRKFA